MMNKNKKAWIRVVEATMGVLLIASVLFVMVARAPKSSENDIYETPRFILEQISKNDSLRKDILAYDEAAPDPLIEQRVDGVIRSMMPSYLDFSFRICQVEAACGIKTYPDKKDVYADEILITSTLDKYKPKKLRLFVWEK